MDELSLYAKILSVTSPWFVESVNLDESDGTVHVYVGLDHENGLHCPLCGAKCSHYDSRPRTWRHLDSCQFKTLVHANIPRTQCKKHGVLQVDVPWAENRSSFTLLFESLVISWLKDASINAVRKQLGISWNAVDGIMKRAVARGLNRQKPSNVEHLAIDEVSSRKGREYVTIISNSRGHVLDVQNDRKKSSVDAYFKGLNESVRASIKTASMDMSGAYISATKENLPQWREAICFDKFHIAMDLNKAVNAVRKSESKKVAHEHRRNLHHSRFIWLRSEPNLTENHRQTINTLSRVATKTARAWAIRQYAMSLWSFENRIYAEEAWKQWYGWAIRSQLNPIKTAAKSIKKNLWGIINAIVHNQNNARAESLNSKIKILKVRAKGFRNKERFKTAILFHLGGLELYPGKAPT